MVVEYIYLSKAPEDFGCTRGDMYLAMSLSLVQEKKTDIWEVLGTALGFLSLCGPFYAMYSPCFSSCTFLLHSSFH